MPSDRAVGWLGLSESVFVSERPSGSSCGVVAEHAPGMVFGVRSSGEKLLCAFTAAGLGPAVAGDATVSPSEPGSAARMFTSGMTLETAGLSLSSFSSPFETVAEKALISWKRSTWVACTCCNWFMSGTCFAMTDRARSLAARVPTRACFTCFCMITTTFRFTFCDS